MDPAIIGDVVAQARGQFDTWLHQQVFNNSFLIAGAGTVLLGAASYLLKSVPAKIWQFVLRSFTLEIVVNNDREAFYDIARFLQRRRINWLQRTFMVGGGAVGDQWMLGPGYGSSLFLFEHRPVFGILQREESNSFNFKLSLTLRFWGRSRQRLSRFLAAARREAICVDRDGIDIVLLGAGGYWSTIVREKPRRPIESVFMPEPVKADLIERLNWFYANEGWYRRRGLAHKFGVLLTGPGGTGKSSLIHALASHYDKNIRLLNLNVLTDGSVGSMLAGLTSRDMLVIEDIDTFSVTHDRRPRRKSPPADLVAQPVPPGADVDEQDDRSLSLSSLLNIFDGVLSPDGVVTIATSNHPEVLDGPLSRKGRFDLRIEIGPLDADCFRRMFEAFYGEENCHLVDHFIRAGHYRPIVGAVAQDLFRHHAPEEALRVLS